VLASAKTHVSRSMTTSQSFTVTSLAVLTNGSIEAVVATKIYHYVTTAAGLLGVTITTGAGSYYPVFVMPNGSLEIGTVCTVNA